MPTARFHTLTMMVRIVVLLKALLALSLLLTACAFVIPSKSITSTSSNFARRRSNSRLSLVPPSLEILDHATKAADLVSSSNTQLLSFEMNENVGEAIKTVLITLFFGGGLIPALIGGNKAMMKTLAGGKTRSDAASEGDNPETSLDPTLGDPLRAYVEDSGATGPEMPLSGLLFSSEKIPLADIVAVVGRIQSTDSLVDWKNLPSAKLEGLANPNNPPMWLPRGAFKVYVRKSPFLGWPNDPTTGQPVGGTELQQQEESRISKNGALIGDAALDAVFDSWTWGASVATPDKVENGLRDWRRSVEEFDISKFSKAAAFGRGQTALGALTFIVIQVVAFGTLFVGPALRVFANVDIGFGTMGQCANPETCIHLWNP